MANEVNEVKVVGIRKGCPHNWLRRITYPELGIDGNGRLTFGSGDYMVMTCPVGCPDIQVALK